ncbi:translation initiation factor IF-2 [Levyella massiliensis]|uniref:translation initiation factor IF-2 n=1 Tax=Levyella massiliensis TaxID=938289 RepID=UPI0004AF5FCD|nr:translation initiation factor IF-2 [Levyella massiliensis]
MPPNIVEASAEEERETPKRGKKKKPQKKQDKPVEKAPEDDLDSIIEIPAEITVGDFAKAIHKNSMDVITELIKMGIMAGLNESITFDTASTVAEKFGVLITEPEESNEDEIFESLNFDDDPKDLASRPPVVTVMGHVDHGKTSLLDAIRETAVTRGEAGGITQHIGASVAIVDGQPITFIDTPGHEAFTQMRSRGAQTTDIVILVVAADDGVMPQTIEAINHSKAAGVPIVVAINKMDRPGADPNRVMTELAEQGLVPEEWGGDVIMIPISAKTHQGIEDLLQMVIMVAEMEELKANPKRPAIGVVLESQIERGRGATASVLVQTGTLYDKDYVVSGQVSGHIRAMFDSHGKKVHKAGPSVPVKITGLSDLPEAGDAIYAVSNEKAARSFAEKVAQRNRDERLNKTTHISLDDLHMQISEDGLKELNLIVKTDVKGTIDALAGSLAKLSNDEVKVNIIHGAVGGISESDVMLATASNAIIIGFNVRPNQGAIRQAERDEIDIRTYRVIYDAIEDIEQAIKGMLSPTIKEEVLGRCEVRDTFKVPNAGTVAGIYVTSGKIVRNAGVRLLRNDVVIHEGTISSLRRFKDDVKEIASGFEGGLGIDRYNDVKVGDSIECFHEVEVPVE